MDFFMVFKEFKETTFSENVVNMQTFKLFHSKTNSVVRSSSQQDTFIFDIV